MVFVSDRNGSLDIYAMEDDGSNVTPVVVRILWQDFDPCLSPDGLKVVFVAEVAGDSQIWVWDSATNTELKLTDTSGAKATPVFSPDGTKIAFCNTSENEIYLMNADGSNLTKLTNTPSKEDRDPAFSKDGTRILFASQQGVQLTPTFGIYSMNLDGSDIQKVVDDITNEVQPWLSTDGTKLLYRENNNITIANADGTSSKKLTTKGNCTRPTFTRNGTRIIYTVNDGGESLFSMDLDGGDNKKISGIGSNSSARGRP
jgi:TolB protein